MSVALALLGSGVAAAQVAGNPQSLREAEEKLQVKKLELEKNRARSKDLNKTAADIDREREDINRRLVEAGAKVQAKEAELTVLESQLAKREEEEKALRGSLAARHGEISKLLAALQRMGRNPPPVMITRSDDAVAMARSASIIAWAFPHMRTQALSLAGQLNTLVAVMEDIRGKRDSLKKETETITDLQTQLSTLIDKKKNSLDATRAEIAEAKRSAAAISQSVDTLSDLITKLDREVSKSQAVAEHQAEARDAIDRAEAKTRAEVRPAEPAGVAQPPAAATVAEAVKPEAEEKPIGALAALAPATPPPPGGGGSVVELAPTATVLALGNPGRIKPALPFQLAHGRLPMPAQGRRVLAFGDKTQYGATSKGLVIETRPNARVTSPCDGWIVYAGEFRSYGQLLIINAGGGYHVLVAGLSQIDVQPGQFVLAAEPVGVMSGATRLAAAGPTAGAEAAAAQVTPHGGAQSMSPVLYVEFRKDGQPVDPDPWWGSSWKVQG